MCALLSIKPEYAAAIFRGEKRFEFRRAIFRQPVTKVIVYVTSPTCKVAGEFDVKTVLSRPVVELWQFTNQHAGINAEKFFDYFKGRAMGHAIVIGEVRRYTTPQDLHTTYGVRAPQSFLYVQQA
jgi:predicted transcriptional regulator